MDRRLKELRPDALTVEISPWSIAWRERLGPRLRRRLFRSVISANLRTARDCHGARFNSNHGARFNSNGARFNSNGAGFVSPMIRNYPQLRLLLLQIAMPYEWRTAWRHHRNRGIPLTPVERSGDVRGRFVEIRRLVSPENIRFLLENSVTTRDLQNAFQREESLARREAFPQTPGPGFNGTNSMPSDPREAHFCRSVAEAFRVLRSNHVAGTLVHICGWRHLAPLYLNLAPEFSGASLSAELLEYPL